MATTATPSYASPSANTPTQDFSSFYAPRRNDKAAIGFLLIAVVHLGFYIFWRIFHTIGANAENISEFYDRWGIIVKLGRVAEIAIIPLICLVFTDRKEFKALFLVLTIAAFAWKVYENFFSP